MLSRPAAALLLILASAALHPAASASARDRARTVVQTRILISGVLAIATGYIPQSHIIYLNGSAPDDFADGKNASDGSRHLSDLDQYYEVRSLCSCIFLNSLASIFSSLTILSLLCQEEGDTGYIGNGFFWFVQFVSQTTFTFSFGLANITGGIFAWQLARMAHDFTPYCFMAMFFPLSFLIALKFSWPKASPQIGELHVNQANAGNAQQANAQADKANNV